MSKETNEVLDFGIALLSAIRSSKGDGRIDFSDVQYLPQVFLAAPSAFKGIEKVLAELEDPTPEQLDVIYSKLSVIFGDGRLAPFALAQIKAFLELYKALSKDSETPSA